MLSRFDEPPLRFSAERANDKPYPEINPIVSGDSYCKSYSAGFPRRRRGKSRNKIHFNWVNYCYTMYCRF